MASRVRRRGTGAVIAGAAVCALALPAVAQAAEGPDPVIVGSCAATLDGNADPRAAHTATPLTADAGAAAEAPGALTVGLGTESEGTNGHSDPLLAVPVSDTLDSVGATSTPVVSDAATGACEAAKPVVNDAAGAVQNIVPVDDVTDPGPGASSDIQPPGDPSGEKPGEGSHPGGWAASIAAGPGFGGFGGFDGAGVLDAFGESALPAVLAGGGLDALGRITLPPAATIEQPAQAPALNSPTPERGGPDDRARESGTAQAVPTLDTQDRLPLLLAVIALALAAAALRKAFQDRNPA